MDHAQPLLDQDVTPAEAVCRVMIEAGVKFAAGIPGGGLMPIFDALFDHKDAIDTLLVREESLGSIMAEVYGRVTGQPMVLIAQGAWVLSNAAMGMLEALTGGSPMVVLTDVSDRIPFSHHSPYQTGTGDYGAWDARRAFGGFSKRVIEVHDPAQAVQQVQLAFKHAVTGCPGPVVVVFYGSALRGSVGPQSVPRLYQSRGYLNGDRPSADPAAVSRAAKAIASAQRPVLLVGNGARTGQAAQSVIDAATRIGAPILTTGSGKGVISETHPLAAGVIGDYGHAAAIDLLGAADLILAVGTRLAPGDTLRQNSDVLDPSRQTLIQIDIEPLHVGWTHPVHHALVGDGATVLRQLCAALPEGFVARQDGPARIQAAAAAGWYEAEECRSDASPILPQRLVRSLCDALPDDAVVCADAGENRIFLLHHYRTRSTGGYLQPGSMGGMGYSIPMALGMKLADPSRVAVAFVGDGGFSMTMNGLMSSQELNLPIIVVVMNNNALAWVKHVQGNRVIASELSAFDHAAIARAMGCRGVRVEQPDDLAPAVRAAVESGRTTVIDVVTSMEESWEKVTHPLSELKIKLGKR